MARSDRYVALGLAHARSTWFSEVGRWSVSAALPLEFVKCVTVEEVRARFRTGRPFSALLVDGTVPGFDRDLVDEATSCGSAVIVIDDGRSRRDWRALGATAVLASGFDRNDLLDVLEANTVRIGVGLDEQFTRADTDVGAVSGWRGDLVAVTGPGGTGASVIAMALAQGLAADVRIGGLVALADLALDADQAMLHDAGDVVPGIQELVEIHRNAAPSAMDVRQLAYTVTDRNYDLLLGLRRHRDWVTIRPRAFDAALDGLRRTYKTVVADVSNDVEGERQCGSVDVEERNLMARSTTAAADVVVVVGAAGPRGIHRLVRLMAVLVDHGVDEGRILAVVNRAPRGPRNRAEITSALSALTRAFTPAATLPSPAFVGDRRRLDEILHAGGRLPDPMVSPVSAAVRMMLERRDDSAASRGSLPALVPVAPGSLGVWSDEA
jgi:MinD-like ATPase involved in chromosome partitioning or flagellar assembly